MDLEVVEWTIVIAKRKKNRLSQWLNVAFKKKAGAARETKTGLFARKKEKLGRWNIGLNLILQFEEKCSKKCQVEKGKNACLLPVCFHFLMIESRNNNGWLFIALAFWKWITIHFKQVCVKHITRSNNIYFSLVDK